MEELKAKLLERLNLTEQDFENMVNEERIKLEQTTDSFPNKISTLESKNADLWYSVMTNEIKTQTNEQEIANLWYEVMMA